MAKVKYNQKSINEMRNFVIDKLVNNYNYDYNEAKKIVNNSIFNQLLIEDTNYVFHYSVDYWAQEVNKEIQ